MQKLRSHCTRCRSDRTPENPLSSRGLCQRCAEAAVKANVQAMVERTGPAYEKWRRRWVESGGNAGRPITPY